MIIKKIICLFLIISADSFCQSKFLLIMGPSGTGKSTIIKHLKNLDERFEYVIPLTTRQLREGEQDKVHVSIDEIKNLEAAGKLLTVNHIYGIYYATPKETIDNALAQERFPVLDWPIEKLNVMTEHYGKQLYKVYVAPDDLEELQRRLMQDSRDTDGKRLRAGIEEIDNFVAGKYDQSIDLKVVNKKDHDKEIAQYIYTNFLKSLEN